MMENVHLLRYLWRVYRELPGSWKQKRKIVAQMGASIRDYVSEGANISFEQLVNRFGEPGQIAFVYVNEMESEELVKELKRKKEIVKTIFITAVVIVTLWTGLVIASYADHRKNADGYAVVEIIEVENIDIVEGGN